MTAGPEPLVEAALATAGDAGAVVILEEANAVNLRFANNTLTTNGVERTLRMTVAAVLGHRVGVMSSSALTSPSDVSELVERAVRAARESDPAEDAADLVSGSAAADFSAAAATTGPEVLTGVVAGLAEAFDTARTDGLRLYGFARHEVSTTYLATSAGVRRRQVNPVGTIDMTGRTPDGSASAWAGSATVDFADVNAAHLAASVSERLRWARTRVELPPGRYETLLPAGAVADLLGALPWMMSARAAAEGRSPFSRTGGGTRLGDRLSAHPLTLFSDPAYPGLECAPFVVCTAAEEEASLFDNGLPIGRTDWISNGELTSLVASRSTAARTGLPVRPEPGNVVIESATPAGNLDELIRSTRRGLLLTCLFYIRTVDPQTMLVTGLTRDGVFLVENGEVVATVNNFRFNDSPLGVLSRTIEVGTTARTLPREFQEYLPRMATPPMRIADFNMSSVSQAT